MKQTADWRCLPGLSLQRISEFRTTAPDLQRAHDQEPVAALRLVCRCCSGIAYWRDGQAQTPWRRLRFISTFGLASLESGACTGLGPSSSNTQRKQFS